ARSIHLFNRDRASLDCAGRAASAPALVGENYSQQKLSMEVGRRTRQSLHDLLQAPANGRNSGLYEITISTHSDKFITARRLVRRCRASRQNVRSRTAHVHDDASLFCPEWM